MREWEKLLGPEPLDGKGIPGDAGSQAPGRIVRRAFCQRAAKHSPDSHGINGPAPVLSKAANRHYRRHGALQRRIVRGIKKYRIVDDYRFAGFAAMPRPPFCGGIAGLHFGSDESWGD